MWKVTRSLLLCAASTVVAAGQIQPETFVIQGGQSGREATITIPVGAVTTFSANAAEALVSYSDPKVEAMRLSGDVLINVVGATRPIQITADHVVLELTADDRPLKGASSYLPTHAIRRLESSAVIPGDNHSQTFVGDVVFTLETPAGLMQIKADRIEHNARPIEGA